MRIGVFSLYLRIFFLFSQCMCSQYDILVRIFHFFIYMFCVFFVRAHPFVGMYDSVCDVWVRFWLICVCLPVYLVVQCLSVFLLYGMVHGFVLYDCFVQICVAWVFRSSICVCCMSNCV